MRRHESTICLTLVLAGAACFAIVFGTLGVRNHRGFGTWAYDMAIYDQAIWLVSRGGQTFMTVRGLDVWGHHFNPILYAFVPFYWLGAGPELLYVVQNAVIGLGALPVYLIAKHRFGRPVVGLLFAAIYLVYTPVQFIAWVNFHPEALSITPFLFAWYCATTRRWRWYFVSLVLALITREDVALAVVMLGLVLAITNRRAATARRDLQMAAATILLGAVWYALATQVIIPHFNHGDQAFYLQNFFGDYGGTFPGIARNIVRHPNWVVRDAVQHDRLVFYKKLLWPLGFAPLASPRAPVDGAAADDGQRDRRPGVRPAHRVPVHRDHDRPVHDRRGRGRAQRRAVDARVAAPDGAQGGPRAVARRLRLGDERGVVTVARRRALRRVVPAQPTGRGDAIGGRARAGRRRRHVVVRHRPPPVAAGAVLRLAEPVLAGVLGGVDPDVHRLHPLPERVGRALPGAGHEPVPRGRSRSATSSSR